MSKTPITNVDLQRFSYRVGFFVCGILNRPLRAAAFSFCSNVLAFGTKIMGSGSREVEDLCRVCAKDKSNIQLFSESGMKHKLINKIKKYLSIVVLANDKLPLGICYGCAKKLDSIHRFVRNAQEAQNNLKDLMKYEKYHAQPDTSGSLLHSILTRGNNLEERNGMKSENMDEEEEEEEEEQLEVTKMEVDIDPMLFLVPDEDSQSDDKADLKETSSHLNNNVNEMYEKQERVKPYRCSICPRGFNTEIGLQNHLWSHLPTANRVLTKTKFQSLKDKGCVYSSNGVLRTASVAEPVVNNSGPLTCPVCGKLISTKGNLKVHLETHRPKGRYDCDICGRIFKTPSNLSRHKEYHEYVQFPCKVCGRVYPTNSTLRAHSITHSNLRPHKCPLCDKTFKRNQDLKFHINQHTGARPYQCPYCPKAFASSGNCFSHRKRMHSDEVERDRELAGGESE